MRFALSRLILGLLLIGLASALLLFSDLNHRTTRVGQRQAATSGIAALSTANEQNATVSQQAPALSKVAATDGTSLAPTPPGVSKAPAHRWNMHFINFVDAAHVEETLDGFFQDFKKLGLVEGRDYSMRVSNAQGDMATLMSLVDNAVTDRAELILLTSTPTLQAAIKRAGNIPILFTTVMNPILAGAGESFEKHLPNVTGISSLSDFDGMLRVVKECLPTVRTVGSLFVPSEVNSVCCKDELVKATQKAGIKLITVPVYNPAEVPMAAGSLATQGIDAICQISDNLCDAAFSGISQTAHNEKIPLFTFVTSLAVKQGAAIAVARDYRQGGRDLAALTQSFLKGAAIKDIPFTYIHKTLLTINVKNAERCGLNLPSGVLARADNVIR